MYQFSDSSGSTPHKVGEEKKNPKQKRQILAKIDFGPLAQQYFHVEYQLL